MIRAARYLYQTFAVEIAAAFLLAGVWCITTVLFSFEGAPL